MAPEPESSLILDLACSLRIAPGQQLRLLYLDFAVGILAETYGGFFVDWLNWLVLRPFA